MTTEDNPDHRNPKFVTVPDCRERHAKIELALFGPDGRGGIVKDIFEIKNVVKHRWTLKDLATFIMALAALLAALYQYFFH